MAAYIIHPCERYNEIPFCCSQNEVQEIAGQAYKILIDNIMKETYEYREGSTKLTFVNDQFVDVWIPQKPAMNQVYLNTMPPYMDLFDNSVFELLKQNYSYQEAKDKRCILFPELGICMWGCGEKRTKEGKIIIAFCKERISRYELFLNA